MILLGEDSTFYKSGIALVENTRDYAFEEYDSTHNVKK